MRDVSFSYIVYRRGGGGGGGVWGWAFVRLFVRSNNLPSALVH